MCLEVLNCSSVHTLPNRRNASVLGLVNVRGELLVCLSLAGLLGAPRAAKSSTRRLVVVGGNGAPMALEVDEAHGIHRFNRRELAALPDTLATASSRLTCATLRWKDHTIGVVDQRALAMGMTGSLA
jgi:chemotaxis-related protein WspD